MKTIGAFRDACLERLPSVSIITKIAFQNAFSAVFTLELQKEEKVVVRYKKKSFATRNIAEKREIIRAGGPTTALKTKVDTRTFQKNF